MNHDPRTATIERAPRRGALAHSGPPKPRRRWLAALGLVLVGLLGVATGGLVGAPGAAERAALEAVGRLERRFGVRVEAERVEWTWGGRVEAHGLAVFVGDEVLATASRAVVVAEVALGERRVRIASIELEEPALRVTRSPDGRTNLDRVLAGFERGGAGGGLAGGVTLDPSWPEVRGVGARLVLEPGMTGRPMGLAIPARVELREGALTLKATGPSTAALKVDFADTSLDPGEALAVEVEVDREAEGIERLQRVAVRPSRPVRFWLGERVVGLGGAAISRAGLELGPLQLSVPVGERGGTTPVAAAATFERIALATEDPIALARELLSRGEGGLSMAQVIDRAGGLTLTRPVLSLAFEGGRHSFEDVLPRGPSPRGSQGVADLPTSQARTDFVRVVGEASRAASDKLLRGAAPKAAEPLAATAKALFERLDGASRRHVPRLARLLEQAARQPIAIEDGELLLRFGGEEIALADLDLETGAVVEGGRRLRASFRSPFAEADGAALVKIDARVGADELEVDVASGALPLSIFGSSVRALHLEPVGRVAALDLKLVAPRTGEGFELSGEARLDGLTFHHRSVTSEPVTGLELAAEGRLRWSAAEGRLIVDEARLRSRGVELGVSLDVAAALNVPKLRLTLELPETPAQRLVDGLPDGFAPLLRGLRMEGLLAWTVAIDLDIANPGGVKVDSRPVARGLQVTHLGERVDFQALRGSHAYAIRLADETPGQRVVGPMTGSWVPLAEITPYLPLALTTTEDGTFYTNDGISTFAMKESIATNLERGAFVRGASTITQQLVKNLYLGGDKTIARKLQEIFLAWQMTQHLSKDEIMALYLNTIEFGPGLYGIGDASWHWFGKRPIDLTLTEAIFLASIIPGPRRYYSFFTQGAVTPRWRSYLEALLKVMVERKKITPEELAAAAPYEPRFRGAGGGYEDVVPDDFDELPDRDEVDDEAAPSPDE